MIKLTIGMYYVADSFADIIYDSDTQSLLLVDKDTRQEIFFFEKPEIKKYFHITLDFDSYQYDYFYLNQTDFYQKKLSRRVYKVTMNLDLKKILKNRFLPASLEESLVYYFCIGQAYELSKIKKYTINQSQVFSFIKYRSENLMYFIDWKYFRINEDYVFDLKEKSIVKSNIIKKIKFKRKGGIIETNNVKMIVQKHFYSMDNLLVILPSTMTNIWPENIFKITYDNLINLKKSEIKDLYTKAKQTKTIKTIIIHECHIQFLVGLKYICNILDCETIWVINSLPLNFYFSFEKTPTLLNINDLSTLSNLWMCFSLTEKTIRKSELQRLFFTKLDQYYAKVYYKNKIFDKYPVIKFKLEPMEKLIYDEFFKYFDCWKKNLHGDTNNIYSTSTLKKNNKLECKIFNSVINLITSVVKNENISLFFKKKIEDTLEITKDIDTKIKNLDKTYNQLNTPENFNFVTMTVLEDAITKISDKKTLIQTKIDTYKNYAKNQIYETTQTAQTIQTKDPSNCLICYGNENLIFTKLICNHLICLECIISSLSQNKYCPVCREYINIQKIAIVYETIKNYSSNLNGYLQDLTPETVIITDLDGLSNISCIYLNKINVLNINDKNISNKIKNINQVTNILIFTCPEKIISKKNLQKLNQIIQYFSLLNKKINFCKLKVSLN